MTWSWQHFKNMIASDESNFCHGCNHDHLRIITTPQGWEVGKLKDLRIQQLADELGQLASWQQGFILLLAIFPFILKYIKISRKKVDVNYLLFLLNLMGFYLLVSGNKYHCAIFHFDYLKLNHGNVMFVPTTVHQWPTFYIFLIKLSI